MADLVWSDPDSERDEFSLSPRGAGYTFGAQVVKKFLQVNSMSHILRAHQLCQEGYQVLYDDRLSTVWSAQITATGAGIWQVFWKSVIQARGSSMCSQRRQRTMCTRITHSRGKTRLQTEVPFLITSCKLPEDSKRLEASCCDIIVVSR